jgi:tRNA dimethylallyltransferase
VLQWPSDRLYPRIDDRVERMFAAGLIEEVRRLLERYGRLSRTASQAAGYREAIEYLQGAYDHEETVARVKARTRRLSRRQRTWFRGLSECRAVVADDVGPQDLAQRIVGRHAVLPGSSRTPR